MVSVHLEMSVYVRHLPADNFLRFTQHFVAMLKQNPLQRALWKSAETKREAPTSQSDNIQLYRGKEA